MMRYSFLILLVSCNICLNAQDTIRFVNGSSLPVKVDEISPTEIKYNRWDNITGPVYVVNKNEVRYIRYVNGMKDTFALVQPKTEVPKTENSSEETPAYVNSTPITPGIEQIQIKGKKIYYHRHGINDKELLGLIRKYPDQGIQNLMLKEYSKLSIYKNNRRISLFVMYGGIVASLFAIGSSGNGAPAFVVGTAAGISGAIMATINKNKRKAKRVHIAKIYNGSFQEAK